MTHRVRHYPIWRGAYVGPAESMSCVVCLYNSRYVYVSHVYKQ